MPVWSPRCARKHGVAAALPRPRAPEEEVVVAGQSRALALHSHTFSRTDGDEGKLLTLEDYALKNGTQQAFPPSDRFTRSCIQTS